MTYTKPEINLLGDAAQLIQNFSKQIPRDPDGVPPFDLDPAYDLDE